MPKISKTVVSVIPQNRCSACMRVFFYPLLLCISLLLWPACAWSELAPYEPEEGCYIGAYIELDHNVDGDFDKFEALTGRPHASYFRYVGYGQPFPFRWAKEVVARGGSPHIAWEPNHGLEEVRDDDYLRGWAQAARHVEAPIFMRYASEMNGNWMAYSGDPDLYIEKWRLVYRVMREAAPNVIMVWCPFSTPRATIPLYYPGDEYVDWVGVNIYSVLHQNGDVSNPPSEDPRTLLKYVYDLFAYRKPIAIMEYAATSFCVASQKETIDFAIENMTKLYNSLVKDFPRVRMINWFSVDTVSKKLANNNYCVTDDPRILETYRTLISQPHFLTRVIGTPQPEWEPGRQPVIAAAPAEGPDQPTVRQPAVLTGPPPETSVPLAGTRLGQAPSDGVILVVQGAPPGRITGPVELVADIGSQVAKEADTAEFFIDGRFLAITNVQPFRCTWSADRWPEGERRLRIVINDAYGRELASTEVAVVVVSGG